MSETPQHPAVAHPVHLRIRRHRDGMGPIGKANDWLATHLAVVFGVCWTIWVFFIVPIVAYFLPQPIQNKIFFFSSGWIQLFALPLMVYVGQQAPAVLRRAVRSDPPGPDSHRDGQRPEQDADRAEHRTDRRRSTRSSRRCPAAPPKTLVRKPAKEAGA